MGQLLTPSAGQSEYLHEEEIWGDDPVHLTTKGHGMVAAGLESLIYEKRGEEREAEEKESQGPSKKPRHDAAESRPARVMGSVAEAVRRGGGGGHPRPPFKHPWRGSNQIRGGRGGPTPGKDPAETVGSTTAMDPDPDSRVTGAATGGGLWSL
jgi:hypothetical protein